MLGTAYRVRVGATLVVAALLIVASPAAATEVASQPGALQVILDSSTTHTIEIEDSIIDRSRHEVVYGSDSLPAFTSAGLALPLIAPQPSPGPAIKPGFSPWSLAVFLALQVAWAKLSERTQQDPDEDDDHETTVAVMVTDREGHAVDYGLSDSGCRAVRYAQGTDLPDEPESTVKCFVFPGTLYPVAGNPAADPWAGDPQCDPAALKQRLVVAGGAQRDRIVVKQHFPGLLNCRFVDGAGGADSIVGSEYDDVLVGGTGKDTLKGRDGIDWLKVDDDLSADWTDCGDPGESTEPDGPLGDLIDPAWNDFDEMHRCEDVAFPLLPEQTS